MCDAAAALDTASRAPRGSGQSTAVTKLASFLFRLILFYFFSKFNRHCVRRWPVFKRLFVPMRRNVVHQQLYLVCLFFCLFVCLFSVNVTNCFFCIASLSSSAIENVRSKVAHRLQPLTSAPFPPALDNQAVCCIITFFLLLNLLNFVFFSFPEG
jgi:hypothetical protein